MIGIGTIINTAAILLGGCIGVMCKKLLSEKMQDTLLKANGVVVLFIGMAGALEKMLKVTQDGLKTQGTMMLILTVTLGAVLGELLDIEGKMEKFGRWLKVKTKSENDTTFLDGFLTASFTVCIGAMAVVGSIQDGILGDYSLLSAKAVLDFIIVMAMAASMGKGCIFSAIPVAIFQGTITLLAKLIQPLMTDMALVNLSLTGSVLIFCVGVNIVWGKKFKVANLLPTLLFAVLWTFLPFGM